MIRKVKKYIEEYKMLQAGDFVAAGISGGADSVCLLFVLKKLQETISFRLVAVHVNHGIRKEAGEDEAYVIQLCETLEIPCFVKRGDVKELAKEQGISEEEMGRNFRYQAFEEILHREGAHECSLGKAKIAVAHHSNDRAETMLFHLFRGTGLTGLASIPPVRDNIIRPLLCLSRQDIETYLQELSVKYCIDVTNSEDTYTRNKIRNHILPYVLREISPTAIESMNRSAEILWKAKEFIQIEVNRAYTKCLIQEGEEISLNIELLQNEAPYLQGEIMLRALGSLIPGRRDIGAVHVEDLLQIICARESKTLDLPYGICAIKEYEVLTFKTKNKGEKNRTPSDFMDTLEIPLDTFPVSVDLGEAGILDFSLITEKKSAEIPQKKYTKWFDYDKIKKSLVLRKRKSGDYLTINTAMSKKSLKDYMIQEKIPRSFRDQVWILCEGSHALWVVGYRISHYYKINENTKCILQVQLRGGQTWQNM